MPNVKSVGQIDTFNLVERIGNFITNNVEDVRSNRTSDRWVYPTFPKTGTNYPQVVVEIKQVIYNETAADRFLQTVSGENGDYKEYFYREADAIVLLTILSEKESQYEVERQGNKMYLTNQPLNLYIADLISEQIKIKKYDLMNESEFIDIRETRKTPVYDNDPQSWASEIRLEVEFLDVWVKDYSSTGELVSEYSLTTEVIMEED